MSKTNSIATEKENRLIYVLLGLFALIILIARCHLLSMPLERDEGEYAYMAKLILDGHPPYTLACNMKLPGTYYLYAIIMKIFGATSQGIHIGLMVVSLMSMLLLFKITDKLIGKNAALITAITFGIIGTSWTILGQAAHATQFVSLFALFGLNSLLKNEGQETNTKFPYLLSGIYFSLAFICKQSGIFFLPIGIVIIIYNDHIRRNIKEQVVNTLIRMIGFAIPIIIMNLYFLFWGDYESFKFWTIDFLSKYGNTVPISKAPEMFLQGISIITNGYSREGYVILWAISILGIIALFLNQRIKRKRIIIIAILLFSFLSILPGYYFRQHYFITYLPAMAIAVGLFFDYIRIEIEKRSQSTIYSKLPLLIFLITISISIQSNAAYLFTQENIISSKNIYRLNPFAESVEIGEYLNKNSSHDDKIAILGSEPEILFYADRYSATRHIYAYNWVEDQPYASEMQREAIKEIEINKPEYILYVNIDVSWLLRPNSDDQIFKWADKYIRKNYQAVGVLNVKRDVVEPLITESELNSFQPTSKELIFIYRRNKK